MLPCLIRNGGALGVSLGEPSANSLLIVEPRERLEQVEAPLQVVRLAPRV
jgi:hypothetical protein